MSINKTINFQTENCKYCENIKYLNTNKYNIGYVLHLYMTDDGWKSYNQFIDYNYLGTLVLERGIKPIFKHLDIRIIVANE